MIALLQRVLEASVLVSEADNENVTGSIGHGILALIGVEKGDTQVQADRLLQRILAYRMFDDSDGHMNLDIRQSEGAMLLVPQFTLAADTNKGNRPGFSSAARPEDARRLFGHLVENAHTALENCETGKFGAHMRVSLINDGPVTFSLRVAPASA